MLEMTPPPCIYASIYIHLYLACKCTWQFKWQDVLNDIYEGFFQFKERVRVVFVNCPSLCSWGRGRGEIS
jgi:hypothetical protein